MGQITVAVAVLNMEGLFLTQYVMIWIVVLKFNEIYY